MRPPAQTSQSTGQMTAVSAPLSLGFADCFTLLLSVALMAVAVLWPRKNLQA